MKTSLIISAVISSLLFAAFAHAGVRKDGVIESVDHTNKLMVVTFKNGQSEQYSVADHTRVIVDGEQKNMAALAPSQEVTITVAEDAQDYVRATIVEMDPQTGVAIVQTLNAKESFAVRVTDATKVSGKASSVGELSKGQTIKLRYASNI